MDGKRFIGWEAVMEFYSFYRAKTEYVNWRCEVNLGKFLWGITTDIPSIASSLADHWLALAPIFHAFISLLFEFRIALNYPIHGAEEQSPWLGSALTKLFHLFEIMAVNSISLSASMILWENLEANGASKAMPRLTKRIILLINYKLMMW